MFDRLGRIARNSVPRYGARDRCGPFSAMARDLAEAFRMAGNLFLGPDGSQAYPNNHEPDRQQAFVE